jgi:hypothetical protein
VTQLWWPRDRRVAARLGFKRQHDRTCMEGKNTVSYDNARGSSMTVLHSARWSGSRRRCGNGETRERTGSATTSVTGKGATRDAGRQLVAG